MSVNWRPLASLCQLPVTGAPGNAGAAGVAAPVVGAAGVEAAVVLCSLMLPDFSVLSLQLAAQRASAAPRAMNRFDIRDSFQVGRGAQAPITQAPPQPAPS